MSALDALASALVSELGGRLEGEDRQLTGIAPLETAGPGELAPYLHRRYARAAHASRAGVTLTRPELFARSEPAAWEHLPGRSYWLHDDPERALDALLARVARGLAASRVLGVHESAVVEPGAELAPGVSIGPLAYVGRGARVGEGSVVAAGAIVEAGAVIGRECVIGARAVLTGAARLGDRVRVGPGAVVGSEGFGFRVGQAPSRGYSGPDAGPRRIPHVGLAVLEDDVEIGANTCVARATFGETRIRHHAKIDNLVQVGHNVDVGEGAVMAAQAGIAGSTRLGTGVLLGGQAGIADHLTIGDHARIAAKAGVIGDVPADTTVAGYPAVPRVSWLRAWARLLRPERKR